MIRITTFGGLSIDAPGRDTARLLAQSHQCALLVYLAVERSATREELTALLWPNHETADPRRALALALDALIDTLGEDTIVEHDGTVAIHAAVQLDVHEFDAAVTAGEYGRALQLFEGTFLDGLRVPGAPLFDRWAEIRRIAIAASRERARVALRAPSDATAVVPNRDNARPSDDAHPPIARLTRMLRFVGELQRRRVFRVAATYAVSAFVIAQVVALVVPELLLPEGTTRLVLIVLLLGFPVALGMAWLFELTAEGELRWEEPLGGLGLLLWAGRSPWRIMGVATLAFMVISAGVWSAFNWPDFRAPPTGNDHDELDNTRYVVFPFERAADAAAELNEAQFLYDALSRWQGITVVDMLAVRDALGSRSGPMSGIEAQTLAASFGAGRFVRGSVTRQGELIRLYTALHDTRDGLLLADTTIEYAAQLTLYDSAYVRIATSLLVRGAGVSGAAGEVAPGTRSFPAHIAFLWGQDARQSWDLAKAESEFAAALELDPDYARAALWRAQVLNWMGRPPEELRVLADRAAAARAELSEQERLLTDGLVQLARGAYGDACATYGALRQLNERDFAAWFGLGECHARDNAVIPDRNSPSQWSFRSSYHQASEAYHRAFTLLPSAHRGFRSRTFERVRSLFYTNTDRPRAGRALSPDTTFFLASPAWIGDTLTFIPYPFADFAAGRAGTRHASLATAVQRQRTIFQNIAVTWSRAFPRSPDAIEALAVAQELLGDPTALVTLRQARDLAETAADDARMGAREVVLLVKFGTPDQPGDLERARALADTVLRGWRTDAIDDSESVAVIAALTGRVFEMAELMRRTAAAERFPVVIPVSVTMPAAALRAYAAMGGPRDSIAHYEKAVEAAIANQLPENDQRAARHHLMDLAASLAYPRAPLRASVQLGLTSSYQLLRAQAVAASDTSAARLILSAIREQNRAARRRPVELTLDFVLPQAWLYAVLRDTTSAITVLDSTLNTIRWSEPAGLALGFRAASLMWAMVLRAELAAATGDAATAARWARPVTILWARADEPLQPTVSRMQALVERGARRVALTSSPPPAQPIQQTRRQ